MNKRRWLLHVFERAHEPTPQAEARVQRAIRDSVPSGQTSQALLRELEGPDALQQQRLVARIGQIPERHPQRWRLPVSAGQLALAASVAVGTTLVLTHALIDQPEPLATTLDVQTEPADLAPFPGVHLAYNGGYGELGGTTRSPEIQWIAGQLEVEVEPDRGIQLSVHTEEATVRVIGTVFTVEREDAQTTVGVERGKVEVTCSDGEVVELTAGKDHSCASLSPSKLALRALRLRERGAAPDDVLAVVERGLEHATHGDAAWSHLSVLRMQATADAGDADQALAYAERYLEAGHARRQLDVLRLGMELHQEPCALAMAHSAVLSSDQAAPADLVSLSDCSSGDDARALLVRALEAPGLAVQERAAVQERIEQLR